MSTAARPQDARGSGGEPLGGLPWTLAVGLVVVLLEAGALALTAVWFVVELIRSGASDVVLALFLVVFAAAIAASLVFAVRALRGGRRGGRAPAIGWQLLQGATAVGVLQVPGVQPGALRGAVIALVAAAIALVLLLTPQAIRYTADR